MIREVVIAGLVPAIHHAQRFFKKRWMRGSSPRMTRARYLTRSGADTLRVIEKADGNYSAYVPDLPGCVATGTTVKKSKAKSAMRSAFTSMA